MDYEAMVQKALRGVVKESLQHMQENGLEGDHHYYVTFATDHPQAKIPEKIIEQYGDELTIVLQYEYWDLEVGERGFSVTLCFDEDNQNIYIPYSALISFVDPSVKFGLQFTPIIPEGGAMLQAENPDTNNPLRNKTDKNKDTNQLDSTSNVVSFDTFKKK